MRELKKQVNDALMGVNDCWVDAIKDAEEAKKGIDVTAITGKVVKIISQLDEKFSDFGDRNKSTTIKKRFF